MNERRLALVLVSIGGLAYGQSAQPPQLPPGAILHTPQPAPGDAPPAIAPASFSPAQAFRYTTVQFYMRFPSPLQLGDQILAAMGDEAAADILKILDTRSPLSAAETQTALDIVHKAFMVPRAITNVTDRKPAAALALLQKFQATGVDQLVKERIAAESTFLNGVPQNLPPLTLPGNWTPGPNPLPGPIAVP